MARKPTERNGDGYIAQVKELELLRRDNVRIVGELAQKDAAIDHLRSQLSGAQGTIREVAAIATYHIRLSFALGVGAGVVLSLAMWGLSLLFR